MFARNAARCNDDLTDASTASTTARCASPWSAMLRRGCGFVAVSVLGRMPNQIGGRRLDERRVDPLLPVVDAARELTLHVVHEFVDLVLHLLDLPPHVENDLDAGQVHAEIARQR